MCSRRRLGKVGEDLVFGHAVGEVLENIVNGDAGTCDAGLATSDFVDRWRCGPRRELLSNEPSKKGIRVQGSQGPSVGSATGPAPF